MVFLSIKETSLKTSQEKFIFQLGITTPHWSYERFPLKDVRANCFCASLLRTKFKRHVMHRARALGSKVNNNRANSQCYNFVWN